MPGIGLDVKSSMKTLPIRGFSINLTNVFFMIQKFIFLGSFLFLLQACGNEPANTAETAAETQTQSGLEGLKANAVDEGNHLARVQATVKKVQKEYDDTRGQMPGRGRVTVSIDDNYNLIIQNDVEGDVLKTQVNLKNLNPDNGGMMLLPDNKPGDFPGIRLLVMEGKPGVSFLKNGELQKEERYLDIYMPKRTNIENLAPAMSSILNVVHGKVE